ncbi:beta-lactamase/transpeptidase-like protein [Bimuria novae-zelandiae CBS 107.79]|uniref:Beta-lactamase/transpeptidase-like protein n=1 Tax=Bimuria novae-zelandiae CBS 107.79 TaxID=1447943 RepID=A0A6A5UP20_9PLEO|nr:beta-lactamase/transpeptidase-like protein [Bimuria novae-zelandiae CBS 107.79]
MDHFEEVLSQATKKGSNGVPGAAVAIVDRTGTIIYKHVAGFSGVADDAPALEPDQVFWIASCTKLITSVAALQCVERGLITLDEPLNSHLPELASQPIIAASGEKDFFELRDATNPITLRHLLTHSSGAVYDFMNPTLTMWRNSRGETPQLPITGRIDAITFPRIAEAGEVWNYSTSLDWVGVLIERLTKTDLEDYVTRNIAGPLGIKTWTWHLSRKPEVAKKLMRMSNRSPDGTLTSIKTPLFEEPEAESGGAGIYSTLDDYMRFLSDTLKESPVTLKKETMDMMFTPQFEEGSKLQKSMWELSCAPLVGQSIEGVSPNHGLGGFLLPHDVVREESKYFKPKGTLGWHGMANLQWNANREKGLAYLFATQVIPWGDEKNQNLIKEFDTAVWNTYAK